MYVLFVYLFIYLLCLQCSACIFPAHQKRVKECLEFWPLLNYVLWCVFELEKDSYNLPKVFLIQTVNIINEDRMAGVYFIIIIIIVI